MKIIATTSHPELGELIAKRLDTKLVDCTLKRFANTELNVQINENIRGQDVVIVATGSCNPSTGWSVNDSLIEALLIADACQRSDVGKTILLLASYPYARQDKKDSPRVPISSKMVANMITGSGADRVVSMDLHSGQIQGYMDISFDNIYATKLFIDYFQQNLFAEYSKKELQEKFVLISPDNGGAKRITDYSNRLQLNNVIMHKKRNYTKMNTVDETILITNETLNGKTGIVIDDMADTMGTMIKATVALWAVGIKELIVVVTHGVFSGPALDRINECDMITSVIVTNSLPQEANAKKCDKLRVIDTSKLLAEVVRRIVQGGSISALFE